MERVSPQSSIAPARPADSESFKLSRLCRCLLFLLRWRFTVSLCQPVALLYRNCVTVSVLLSCYKPTASVSSYPHITIPEEIIPANAGRPLRMGPALEPKSSLFSSSAGLSPLLAHADLLNRLMTVPYRDYPCSASTRIWVLHDRDIDHMKMMVVHILSQRIRTWHGCVHRRA